jgi:hypothetical protein
MKVRLLCCFLVWILLGNALEAQTHLKWKFDVGQIYECERSASHAQSVQLKGKTFPSTRESTWNVRLEVIAKDASSVRLRATLATVEHRIQPAVGEELIDAKLGRKMQGSSFTLTVTPQGQLTKLEGYDDFLDRLAAGDKDRRQALRVTFAEDALRQAFADLFGPLPNKAIVKGDRWQHALLEPMPHFGTLRHTAKYVHAGDQLDYTIATKVELPKDDMSVLFRITKGSVTEEKSAGRMLFDHKAGYLVRHDRNIRLRGVLTVETMERSEAMAFTSDSTLKIRIKLLKK